MAVAYDLAMTSLYLGDKVLCLKKRRKRWTDKTVVNRCGTDCAVGPQRRIAVERQSNRSYNDRVKDLEGIVGRPLWDPGCVKLLSAAVNRCT